MRKLIFIKGFPLFNRANFARTKADSKMDSRISRDFKVDSKANNAKLKNIIVLGIGANIGDVKRTFFHLLAWFLRHPRFSVLKTSPIYQNPAFGYENQPDFYNSLLVLKTSLNLRNIFSLIFYLERKFGRTRKRAFKNAPRKLDIDLIFYNQVILKQPYLTIPHREYQNRESVLIPMKLQAR